MPPIPKFAKAITKRAKAKPKVIAQNKRLRGSKMFKQHRPKIIFTEIPYEGEIESTGELSYKPPRKRMRKASAEGTVVLNLEYIPSTEVLTNKIRDAYKRNLPRVELVNPNFSLEVIPLKGKFRYLLQQIAAYKGSLGKDTLKTPFENATIEYRRGTENMVDKHIIAPKPTTYTDIGRSIDKVLREDKFSKLYEIILGYLMMPANDEYAGKKLSDINVEKSDFFEIRENFKKDVNESEIKKAKKAATSLCAIFMVSESSRNRLFEGGKVSRELFRHNTEENVTAKLNRLPLAGKGGASKARDAAKGRSLSLEWSKILSSMSPPSSDEPFDDEGEKDKLKSAIRAGIDAFLINANIAELQQIAIIMQITP